MSIEEQFDRERNAHAGRAYSDLSDADRAAVAGAVQLLMENPDSEILLAAKRVLWLMHQAYSSELFESRLGMDPAMAHARDEACRAKCAAVIDAIEITTDQDALLAVLNNIHKE